MKVLDELLGKIPENLINGLEKIRLLSPEKAEVYTWRRRMDDTMAFAYESFSQMQKKRENGVLVVDDVAREKFTRSAYTDMAAHLQNMLFAPGYLPIPVDVREVVISPILKIPNPLWIESNEEKSDAGRTMSLAEIECTVLVPLAKQRGVNYQPVWPILEKHEVIDLEFEK